jgi:hypothetical protein
MAARLLARAAPRNQNGSRPQPPSFLPNRDPASGVGLISGPHGRRQGSAPTHAGALLTGSSGAPVSCTNVRGVAGLSWAEPASSALPNAASGTGTRDGGRLSHRPFSPALSAVRPSGYSVPGSCTAPRFAPSAERIEPTGPGNETADTASPAPAMAHELVGTLPAAELSISAQPSTRSKCQISPASN